jgi:hypothetical protein
MSELKEMCDKALALINKLESERDHYKYELSAANALLSAAPQPVQEPAAWVTPDGEGYRMRFEPPVSETPLRWMPLYTTPAPDQGAEIEQLTAQLADARQRTQGIEGMAACMDMVRHDLIEAGIIPADTAPMFVSDAVIRAFKAETARCAAVVRAVTIEVTSADGVVELWDMERLAQMIEGTEPIPPAYQEVKP